MTKTDLTFYNEYFDGIKNISKTKSFTYNQEAGKNEGEIIFESKGHHFNFKVEIPESYPLGEVKFITKDFSGYPHQNFDGSLCLNTSFVNHLYTRLNLEIEKLSNYIEHYIENNKEDSYYEYSAYDSKDLVTLIFQEDDYDSSRFEKPFGKFKYSVLSYEPIGANRIGRTTALIQSIANKEYCWSKAYKDKEFHIGAWVFLDKEPVHTKKQRFTSWSDLTRLLPQDFPEFFRNFCNSSANYELYPKGSEENILLAIGYRIPNNNSFEVQWDLVLLPRFDFPRKSPNINGILARYSKPINWDKTYNSSITRFFGRGALNSKLADKKILIIGNGAVGSSLAEILTRTGVTKLDLADIENVEPGNICRSSFSFIDVAFPKSDRLKGKLESISPFIDVELFHNLKAISQKSKDFVEIYERLKSYEIIFDCTANNEITQMLTNLELSNKVFYISLTNKAKEMICVSNADSSNLIERRNQMLYSFGSFKEPEFREGTGCWHPTFEASYFDINQLLNFTLRKLNSYYAEDKEPKTFYSFFKNEIINYSEDIKFIQPELNLTLTVESSLLKKIEETSRKHFPKEYGGILLGSYINNYTELIISDIICPKKFKSSTISFVPDHKELNEKLKDYYKIYSDKIIYIGEWHSHPNGSNQYSATDFNSIQEVANSKKVNIKNPILLIASYGDNYFEPGFYVYIKGKLHKFKKS